MGISDIVYQEKHRVVMFQDVFDALHIGRSRIRQLVTSIPIFDDKGNVQNIVAIVKSLDSVNQAYYEASISSTVSSLSVVPDNYKSGGNTIIAEDPACAGAWGTGRSSRAPNPPCSSRGSRAREGPVRPLYSRLQRGAKALRDHQLRVVPENLLEEELLDMSAAL